MPQSKRYAKERKGMIQGEPKRDENVFNIPLSLWPKPRTIPGRIMISPHAFTAKTTKRPSLNSIIQRSVSCKMATPSPFPFMTELIAAAAAGGKPSREPSLCNFFYRVLPWKIDAPLFDIYSCCSTLPHTKQLGDFFLSSLFAHPDAAWLPTSNEPRE
jgi:hypothetical protein